MFQSRRRTDRPIEITDQPEMPMTGSSPNDEARFELVTERSALRLAGALLVGGYLLNIVVTLFHPSGNEDNHRAIFTKYADSDAWVAIHLGQFVAVLITLAGLLVLYRALELRGDVAFLPRFAAGATVATAAIWAVLQALDGVALRQAVDAWTDASGRQKSIRFADAETLRWLEWGLQSYFRALLALSFILFGAAIVATRLLPSWIGWVAVLAGALSAAIGIDVGYSGLESGLQDAAGVAFLLAALAFAVGIGVTGGRRAEPLART
jgi:hypothetical protein